MTNSIKDVKSFLANLPTSPGIYKMLDVMGQVIYVGKAKNLKKRISSYFIASSRDAKTESLFHQIANIETSVTNTENEALLLENTLIRTFKPHYNILCKDDKSYPYLLLTQHDFPRLNIHRGARNIPGEYFGPFANASAIRETLNTLQKIFKLRSCGENFFRNRKRPCIQYQIKRCTAPCVGRITTENYLRNVDFLRKFLQGKSDTVIESIIPLMAEAAEKQEYEMAAYYRDEIASLKKLQQQQYVVAQSGNVDVITQVNDVNGVCIGIVMVRNGLVLGSKTFVQETAAFVEPLEILLSFVTQYYLTPSRREDLPKKIIFGVHGIDKNFVKEFFNENLQHAVAIITRAQGIHAKWVEMARVNAEHVLKKHFSARASFYQHLESLRRVLGLNSLPRRIECFDVSHTQGEATQAACVVFGENGALKNEYRRFNVHGFWGDDYGALQNALSRHYTKLKEHPQFLPDVLMIDGGLGQLHVAQKVLEELQISGIFLLSIAKGPTRKPGLEEIYCQGRHEPYVFASDSPELHFLQQIRDEAHRFAITGQRAKLARARTTSILENIPGIGKKRRTLLLQHFGGLQGLKNATPDDLCKLSGISIELAKKIYEYLHA